MADKGHPAAPTQVADPLTRGAGIAPADGATPVPTRTPGMGIIAKAQAATLGRAPPTGVAAHGSKNVPGPHLRSHYKPEIPRLGAVSPLQSRAHRRILGQRKWPLWHHVGRRRGGENY
ncbi:hypothetical protein HK104_001666 [Borealophlyctis nickersoniae]|nr:hypothetical protein HK104_001666 [Borealophlyctis nickersoniae]